MDKSRRGLYGDVVEELDWSVGEILAALDKTGVADNTLVVFASDNGPWLSYGDHAGTTGNLREGKGTTFEGGVRVPCIIRWPGRVPASEVDDTPWGSIDVFPTIAHAMNTAPVGSIDGRDATDLITGDGGSPRDAYLCYYRTNELQAIRSGRWKLHLPHGYRSMEGRPGGTGGAPTKYTYGVAQGLSLYDLDTDPTEMNDVKDSHPEVLKHMLVIAEQARQDLGDALSEREGTGRREPGRVETTPTP